MASGMTSDDILRLLREHRAELQQLGARRLGLFGSFAHGEARPDSDVDLLVELDQRTFDRYMDLKLRLEELLGRPVDLVLADRLKPALRDRILSTVIDAA
jgi:predicted nucleotidyltransferase